jgi:putative membrane protein
MRFLLRNITLYALSLFALEVLFSGVVIRGGIGTYLLAGVLLTILYYTLRPILQLLTFPLNMATLGLFSILINTFILYIISVLIPNISISPFVFHGFSFLGFIIPRITFNAFFAYVICAVVVSCITTAVSWLFGE